MAQQITWGIGVALAVLGIWGYIGDPVLGLFNVDGTHNLLHLVSGVLGILAALGGERYTKAYLRLFGVVYALLFLIGVFTAGDGKLLGIVEASFADDLLHLVVAVAALWGGYGREKSAPREASVASC